MSGSKMSLKCFVSAVERHKPMSNGLNKPNQKVSYVRYALFETAIERGCEKGVLKI